MTALGPWARTWWERLGFPPFQEDPAERELYLLTSEIEATLRKLRQEPLPGVRATHGRLWRPAFPCCLRFSRLGSLGLRIGSCPAPGTRHTGGRRKPSDQGSEVTRRPKIPCPRSTGAGNPGLITCSYVGREVCASPCRSGFPEDRLRGFDSGLGGFRQEPPNRGVLGIVLARGIHDVIR